jgi:FMN phosphatase YigB (HAD superfamily)
MKRLVVFDLDGTLAASKSPPDAEMASLLHDLLSVVKVAVISGGAWSQFEKQVLPDFHVTRGWQDDRLFQPAARSSFNTLGAGQNSNRPDFTADERAKIVSSLNLAIKAAGFNVEKTWGEAIEDRGSQIT